MRVQGCHQQCHVSVTHISGWLLQILVIHMSRDDLRGQRSRSKRLRKLPFKLGLNEVQLPAGKWSSEFVNQHEGNAPQLNRCHCRTLTCVVEGSCLGSGTTPCPRTHWQAGLQGPSEGWDPLQCDGILGRGPKGRGSLQIEKKNNNNNNENQWNLTLSS